MKKFLKLLIFGIFLVFFLSLFSLTIKAQNDICNQDPKLIPENQLPTCIDKLGEQMSQSKVATQGVQKQIDGIKTRVAFIENDLLVKQKIIDDGYKNLTKLEEILNRAIRDFYIKSYYNSPILAFLSATSASEITQLLAYQKAATDQDKVIIINIAISIQDLEVKKKNLEAEQANLAIVKGKLDKVVADARAYQATLSGKIAVLSARQQQILAQRLASLNIPLSAYAGLGGGCSSDLTNGKNPGFGGGFGLFTYGVPNRIGLNQYGAKARAEAGQDYQDILRAYYNADITSGYNTGINIHVTGTNEYGQSFDDNWNIEDYLKHVYEMPTNWDIKALKAQAVAARSYALSYTNNGQNNICSSQKCQVVKREENSDSWKQAVSETAGIVLTSGGQPISAWFSSTHGGYVFSSSDIGWSGTAFTKRATDATGSINNFSDLKNNAYDKDSPWFYCDWGSRGDYGKTAWLKPDEMADIINVLLLVQKDSGTKEHLYQTDKSNPAGTDTWDAGRVRQELSNKGGSPFNSISSISVVVDFGSGQTTSVNVNGDAGSVSFGGSDFKTYFNLRAPANIQIVGPLYNIERK